ISADGTSRALGAGERVAADAALSDALERGAPGAVAGTVVSVDLFYENGSERASAAGARAGALAVEMEAGPMCALGRAAGIRGGCALAVSDTFGPDGSRRRIGDEQLLTAAERIGAAAIAALAAA